MLRVVIDEPAGKELAVTLDEICREGARRMLAAALELEADEYIAALEDQFDELGRRLVVRNGHARPRTITTAAGAIEIQAVPDPVTAHLPEQRMGILPIVARYQLSRRSPPVLK